MSKNYMIPKVEKRLSSWMEILDRKSKLSQPDSKPVSITISREFGCQGFLLASTLQKMLKDQSKSEWTIFDKSLIDMISKDNDISSHLLENLGKRAKYLDYVISTLMPGWKTEEEAKELITRTIYSVARQGNAIFVGRGAFAITQSLENCFHYRLIAPLEFRIKTYAKATGKSEEEARQIVKEKFAERNDFIRDFYNSDFNGNEFDMIFNNSRMSINEIAKVIVHHLKDKLHLA